MNRTCLKEKMSVHSEDESYKHDLAKMVLMEWLEKRYTVKIEEPFETFRPDLAVYYKSMIIAFYEVTHKNGITGEKLHRIQKWCYKNNVRVPVYEVDAEWILNKCYIPKKIKCTEYITT